MDANRYITQAYAGGSECLLITRLLHNLHEIMLTMACWPFLEKIARRSCNDDNRKLIPIFHNPHQKCRPSPSEGKTGSYFFRLDSVLERETSSRMHGNMLFLLPTEAVTKVEPSVNELC